jgi:hypothetical protein
LGGSGEKGSQFANRLRSGGEVGEELGKERFAVGLTQGEEALSEAWCEGFGHVGVALGEGLEGVDAGEGGLGVFLHELIIAPRGPVRGGGRTGLKRFEIQCVCISQPEPKAGSSRPGSCALFLTFVSMSEQLIFILLVNVDGDISTDRFHKLTR